ncbi:MAG: aldehyde dehydrogenase family protein [gamma proteobacterium symbiont of Bathyaustriella thionipta]|nr:aldehyde dehydrogenase family protein [gamma proteobacterium symbiont of Bathyaustriella thionipta]
MNIREKINKLQIEKRAFINGRYIDSEGDGVIQKKSPIDGRDLSGVCACSVSEVNYAVEIAKECFKSRVWLDKSLEEKKQILLNLASLMECHREELALLDTIETGRAFKNYYYDSIPKAINALRYFSESIDKYYNHCTPNQHGQSVLITKEALGVVALITPWNDPLVVSIWKIAPALLMGNSVIVKPAEQSSFSILLVARLAKEAGVPDGVLNVITGYGESAGKLLALHNDVAGVFFTGSSEVGKKILQYSGQSNMKKVGLECGGKSPFIVTRNYRNIQYAAEVLAKNIFYNQGQICSAPSRAIVDNTIKEVFLGFLVKEMNKYVPSDPFSLDSEVGCVISYIQKQKIQKYINQGIESGMRYYRSKDAVNMNENSIYVQPIIFVDDDIRSDIAQNEIFGPVLLVTGFETIGEALSTANDTKYGLAASIWTNDLDEAYWISQKLEAGMVHVNSYGEDDNKVPFGGIKQSGIGKDKSMYAFHDYSYIKSTLVRYSELNRAYND